jgi:hypothetical protein
LRAEFARLLETLGEERVGRCLENEALSPTTGDSSQRTSGGLLVWLTRPGVAAFTDGSSTWYGCATAVERRATSEPFPC